MKVELKFESEIGSFSGNILDWAPSELLGVVEMARWAPLPSQGVLQVKVDGVEILGDINQQLSEVERLAFEAAPTVGVRRTAPRIEPTPFRHARVHMLGHQEHVGEVSPLAGGAIFVRAITDDGENGVHPYCITCEQAGRHSIEWLTLEAYEAHVKKVTESAAAAVERHRRETTMPDGYRLVRRKDKVCPQWGFQYTTESGKRRVDGFWWDKDLSYHYAWAAHNEGDRCECSDEFDQSAIVDLVDVLDS